MLYSLKKCCFQWQDVRTLLHEIKLWEECLTLYAEDNRNHKLINIKFNYSFLYVTSASTDSMLNLPNKTTNSRTVAMFAIVNI